MKLLFKYIGFALIMLNLWACKDFRADQRDLNVFDPANSFVRFDYKSTLTAPARDTAHVFVQSPLEIQIPVALSASPQSQAVVLTFQLHTQSNLGEAVNYEIRNAAGVASGDRRIFLEAGSFDSFITFKLLAPPPPSPTGQHLLKIELIDISIPNVSLGFPGSGRGRIFEVFIFD